MVNSALITGASGGIGSAVAQELGSDHNVVVHYNNNRQGAEAVVDELKRYENDVIIHQCDITDIEQVQAMVEQAIDEFGSIDVLVNNAGISHCDAGISHSANLQDTVETIQHTIRVNLEGALYCTQAALPKMYRQSQGWIINVASTAAIFGSPTDAAYGASKSGLIGLTKSLAIQYTDAGIFTNAVAPGPTDTKMFANPDRRSKTQERSPIDSLVPPYEIAKAIRLFATTSAITGEILAIEGGMRPSRKI